MDFLSKTVVRYFHSFQGGDFMKKYLSIALSLGLLLLVVQVKADDSAAKTVYGFKTKTLDGKPAELSNYKSKVLLIVNVASKCGFTPQYKGLEALYEKYKDKGFVILGFPCNQFAHQEPGDAKTIESFCSLNYGVTFPLFNKIDVNGANKDPLYAYLETVLPGGDIGWNFTKFLVDRQGRVIQRYSSPVKPEAIETDIEKVLGR
jgi:glutathione peroxidase